jgi:multicomponent Na+:H+ antiporter subunit F
MMELVTTVALALLGLAIVAAVVRIVRGPSLGDRILGLDTITTLGIGIIAVFAVRTGLYLYTDVAIALALLAFLSTVAFARYLLSERKQ